METPELTSAEIRHNISLFRKLLQCGSNIYLWTYDANGELLTTNCPELSMNQLFVRTLCRDKLVKHAAVSILPATLSATPGLLWGAASEYNDGQLAYIHVIGPVFGAQYEEDELSKYFQKYEMPLNYRNRLFSFLTSLPTIQTTQFFRLVLMLHCCVTGQQLDRKDIVPLVTEEETDLPETHNALRNRTRVYMAEQALFSNVREGNRNYRQQLEIARQISSGIDYQSQIPTDQARISVIVFCSLCTRAAIDGGLSPEVAYSIGDHYIQKASRAKTITGLQKIGDRMYDDFINRVHRLKEMSGLSSQVRTCLELLEEYPEENITLADLALRVNYSDYYLSRLFKKETGMSISEYSHKVRINHAKTLLRTTNLPIYEIASRLHYSSSTHFSDRFYRITGKYPQEYREDEVH